MFRVDKTRYGCRLTVEGFMQPDEAGQIFKAIRHAVAGRTDGFGAVVDFRNANVMPRETQEMVKQLQTNSKNSGMKRSAVVLANPITALQLKRLAGETGINTNERYIDASKDPDWEKSAIEWVERGVEPPSP